jgi:membrane associated rhomboid family serine protease
MKIRYNSPVILTFVFTCTVILVLDQISKHALIPAWFMVPGRGNFNSGSVRNWIDLVSHVLGHSGWDHLVNNLLIVLIVGPMLEEIYGGAEMVFMMFITAAATGLANILLFNTALLGASGIVFMMILLASFTNFRKGEIPLTFILVLILYVGSEFLQTFNQDNVAHFAHIIGGFCGSIFGFFRPADQKEIKTRKPKNKPDKMKKPAREKTNKGKEDKSKEEIETLMPLPPETL